MPTRFEMVKYNYFISMELSVNLIKVQIWLFVVSYHVICRHWLELSQYYVRSILEYCSVVWKPFF